MPLPVLLRASYALCNRLGRPLALGVLLFGLLITSFQAISAVQATSLLAMQLKGMVSEERLLELQQTLDGNPSGDIGLMGSELTKEWQLKLDAMTDAEKGLYLRDFFLTFIREGGFLLWASLAVLIALFIFSRAYLLTLAALRPTTFLGALRETARRFPGLVAVWILTGAVSCIWLPVAVSLIALAQPALAVPALFSIAFPIALYPRFAYAPVIRLQDNASVIGSVRLSFERTRGRWWLSLSGLIGLAVVVWMAMTLLQSSLQLLVNSVLPYSFMGMLLYFLVPFLSLAASSFRACGLAVLKEGMAPAPARSA